MVPVRKDKSAISLNRSAFPSWISPNNPSPMANTIKPSRLLSCLTLAACLSPLFSSAQPPNEAITRADAALAAAAPRAQADPAHPIFHVASPAQWLNDPNGPIYFHGFYHLFYQLYPYGDGGGPKYWGHVRSRDLVKWEHLPVALWPSTEYGEAEVWSGCCTINGRGEPMAFYTSIAPGKSALTNAEQWAAVGDKDLITWQKLPTNPVLTEALHCDRKIYDWRDPFIFKEKGQTFLVTGGNLNKAQGGQATINIYEAQNPELTQWKYRGILFMLPEGRDAECPNFFKLGKQWVLFVSPYGKVNYYVGDFDIQTCRFESHHRGLADFGPNFYAPNTMQLSDGKRLMWGWVTGFPGGRGWNGCLTVPRELGLSKDGQLLQTPVPQIKKLRGKSVELRNVRLKAEGATFTLPPTNALEIQAEIAMKSAESISIALKNSADDAKPIVLNFTPTRFKMPNTDAPLSLDKSNPKLSVRIFIDHSVFEIFVNDTVCATKVFPTFSPNAILEIHAQGDTAEIKSLQAWPMKTIW